LPKRQLTGEAGKIAELIQIVKKENLNFRIFLEEGKEK